MPAGGVSTIITSVSHTGNMGIALSVNVSHPVTPLAIKNQGKLGNSAVGIIGKDYLVTVTFYAGAGGAPVTEGTKASFVVTVADLTGGASKTYTLSNMKALGWDLIIADRQGAIYSQTFVNEDDLDNPAFSS